MKATSSEEVKKQELANRLLHAEIQCLKSELSELDSDYKSLGRMTSIEDHSDDSAMTCDQGNEISEFVHHGGEFDIGSEELEPAEVGNFSFLNEFINYLLTFFILEHDFERYVTVGGSS